MVLVLSIGINMRLLTILFLIISQLVFAQQKYLVRVPVADLRIERVLSNQNGDHDYLQDSQSLLGDYLEGIEEAGDFVKVKVLNQEDFSKPLIDWIERKNIVPVDNFPNYNLVVTEPWTNLYVSVPIGKKNLQGYLVPVSLGTYLEGVEKTEESWKVKLPDGKIATAIAKDVSLLKKKSFDEIRQGVLEKAMLLLGSPYYWGGASAYRGDEWFGPHTGVDCSGLVYLLYKAQGMQVPRNSQAQWAFCKQNAKIVPGDLVFLARSETKKVHHVMIYAGDNTLIEAHQTGSTVRLVSFDARIGKPFEQIMSGDLIGNEIVYFGSFFTP
jgi:cell wall-associated NlpC family hydrolase